jgi:hypothetical protein
MSMAASAVIGHQMNQHSHSNHNNSNHILGSVATFVGSAGVGALGAKLFGGKKTPQPTHTPSHPPFQGYQANPPPASYYPNQSQPPQSYQNQQHGPGYYAMGAGAAAAAGAGMYPPHHHQQQQQPPPPAPMHSQNYYGGATQYQAPVSSGPRLFIHGATFADKDVTEKVRSLVTSDQQISIAKMTDTFGDPWPESERKSLTILYQYGDRPLEVWTGRLVSLFQRYLHLLSFQYFQPPYPFFPFKEESCSTSPNWKSFLDNEHQMLTCPKQHRK